MIPRLLRSTNQRGASAVRGMTRMQKLLFVIEQELAAPSGSFNEEVNDAARALEVAGFVRTSEPVAPGPPSFQQMLATVTERAEREDECIAVLLEVEEPTETEAP